MKARRLHLVEKDPWILERVNTGEVLHVGCTDWPLTEERLRAGELLHGKLCRVASRCVGVDLDGDGIAALRKLMPNEEFHEWNGERLDECPYLANSRWDFIVAGDVVEHMDNPGMFLRAAHRLLKDDGTLIVTVPSAFSAKRFFWLALTGNEQVHPDHTGYFSEATLHRMGDRNGFRLAAMHGFQWRNPTLKNRLSNLLASPLLLLTHGRVADEVAVEFVKLNAPTTA